MKNITLTILITSVHFFCHTEPFHFSANMRADAPSGFFKIRKNYVEKQQQRYKEKQTFHLPKSRSRLNNLDFTKQ